MNDDPNSTSGVQSDDFELLKRIIECLRPLSDDAKIHLLKSAITFLRLDSAFNSTVAEISSRVDVSRSSSQHQPSFSVRTEMTPKEFILEKQPQNDIERIACLGYYLAHYRNMPEFKTLDLSKLNTEAAQPKFSNPSVPVDHATRRGFLVATSGWSKQLGALGEQFVQALPDRDAAKKALERVRLRRPRKKRTGNESSDQIEEGTR